MAATTPADVAAAPAAAAAPVAAPQTQGSQPLATPPQALLLPPQQQQQQDGRGEDDFDPEDPFSRMRALARSAARELLQLPALEAAAAAAAAERQALEVAIAKARSQQELEERERATKPLLSMQGELLYISAHSRGEAWEGVAAQLPPHTPAALSDLWDNLTTCTTRGGPLLDTYVAAVVRGWPGPHACSLAVNSLSREDRGKLLSEAPPEQRAAVRAVLQAARGGGGSANNSDGSSGGGGSRQKLHAHPPPAPQPPVYSGHPALTHGPAGMFPSELRDLAEQLAGTQTLDGLLASMINSVKQHTQRRSPSAEAPAAAPAAAPKPPAVAAGGKSAECMLSVLRRHAEQHGLQHLVAEVLGRSKLLHGPPQQQKHQPCAPSHEAPLAAGPWRGGSAAAACDRSSPGTPEQEAAAAAAAAAAHQLMEHSCGAYDLKRSHAQMAADAAPAAMPRAAKKVAT